MADTPQARPELVDDVIDTPHRRTRDARGPGPAGTTGSAARPSAETPMIGTPLTIPQQHRFPRPTGLPASTVEVSR